MVILVLGEKMENWTIVLVTLVLYKVMLLSIGYWASKRVKDEADYFLGGRQLGPFVAALSYSASSSSAWSLLGMSGAAYSFGVSSIWIAGGSILGAVIAWIFVAPRMVEFAHENNIVTIGDFLGHKIDGVWKSRIVKLSAVVILISFSFYVASQFQGAGETFSTTFGLSKVNSIVLGAFIILLYTFMGGFWAVSVTDAIQGVLMVVAAVLLPLFALIKIGGFSALLDGLEMTSQSDLLTLSGSNMGLTALGFALGSLAIGFGPIGQPHLLVRFMALRDQKAMKQARALTLFWFITVFLGMYLVGLTANVLIPNPEFNNEAVLFQLTNMVFHPVVGAIITAAVLSAIMSTADSQLLVGASSISYDLKLGSEYKGKEVLISRLSVVFLVVISVMLTLYIPATIFNRALFAWNALGAAFGPTVVMMLLGWRFSGNIIFSALFIGFLSAMIISFFPDTPGDVVERTVPFILGFGILIFNKKQRQNKLS